MAGLISRRILALFVPTLLAFLSAAYWLRRKRKIKDEFDADSSDVECDPSTSDVRMDGFPNMTLISNGKTYLEHHKEECCENNVNSLSIVTENELPKLIQDVQPTNACCSTNETCSTTVSVPETQAVSSEDEAAESISEENVPPTCEKHEEQSNETVMGEKPVPVSLSGESQEIWKQEDTMLPDIEKHLLDLEKNNEPVSDEHLSKDVRLPAEEPLSQSQPSIHSVTGASSLPNDTDKDSPTASGSPVSSGHSSCSNNFNNNDASDCEVTSSVGTSSISLNELMSVSPVESAKDQPLSFQSDSLLDEDSLVDSGKGSSINLGPVSSCSFTSELDDGVTVKDQTDQQPVCSTSGESYVFSSSHCPASSSRRSNSLAQYFPKELGSPASTSQHNSDSSGVQIQEQNGNNKMATTEVKMFENSMSSPYVYEFELPQELCGRLIGRHGKHVGYIKESTNAAVYIKRHPFNHRLKLAVVEGSRCEVNNAMELIRKKFPPMQFPNVTLAQTNSVLNAVGVAVPESLQLHLPERTSCDVILSSMMSAGHFFLQQPTHPTYSSLSTLDQCMTACYSQGETPRLPPVIEPNVICAAMVMNGWYRAQVTYVHENEDCEIKFVDYGGYSTVPVSSLRQIRSDFMTLPFQASECYLSNVQPMSDLGWTPEASASFEELAQGQILQAIVVDYHEDGTPYVQLYRVQGVSSTFINQELVNRGMAKWVDHHR